MQQPVQPRPFVNGYGCRKIEREMGTRLESKVQSGKTHIPSKGGAYESPSHDRLSYISTCLIGHQVEVQMLDGSVFSGILHATNAENDFGIILKMGHLIKDSSEGRKNTSETYRQPPSKTLIIPGKELVQVTAKVVPTTLDGFRTEFILEKQQELLTDSCISQSRHMEVERQLERWVPDDDTSECPELENIFDAHWNRGWDQFEANETLFGVKSTFNEEIYTTKLARGPRMSELEKEALRIAREIEGEDTRDLHLAEERGIQFHGNLEVDEETRFSAVVREVDDSGVDDCEDILLDTGNDEILQGISSAMDKLSTDTGSRKVTDDAQVSSTSSSLDEIQFSQLSTNYEDTRKQAIAEEAQTSISEDSKSSSRLKMGIKDQDKIISSSPEKLEGVASSKIQGTPQSTNSRARQNPSALSTSADNGLSRTPSVKSFSSEKSTLNPHAKEFKLNPNAKSFNPTQPPLRPTSPASDNSFYYPAVPHMHGMPASIGVGSFSTHQPVIFNTQTTPAPQPFFHPNGPQYGQQVMIGHPQQVVYMPTYPTEMPFRRREY